MILLDTNVLSALMQPAPAREVISWLDRQLPDEIWTSAISVFEIRLGLDLLDEGRRRRAFAEAFETLLENELLGRVANFDRYAAEAAAPLAARRQRSGRTIDFRDTQIAGIALARRATIATRNVRHFEDFGGPVVDPWAAA